MRRALVVVDMQEEFDGSKICQESVKSLIWHTRAKGDWIIVLEYLGYGQTLYPLSIALDYDRVFYARKDRDDGSQEVVRILKQVRARVSEFVICGVNASACVLSTINGLMKKVDVGIVVVAEATANDLRWSPGDHLNELSELSEANPRLKLVPMREFMV